MKSLTASTKRARARLWKQQHIDYGYEVPDHSMAVLLGLTFCIIAPLIAPIALLYFLVSAVLGKYQMQYVYAEEFQSGGKVGFPVQLAMPVAIGSRRAHRFLCHSSNSLLID